MNIILRIIAVLVAPAAAFIWRDGAGGAKWSTDCDFYGHDIGQKSIRGEQCSSACSRRRECTHFTWADGTCYLKHFDSPARASSKRGAVCGWINRSGPSRASEKSGKTTRYWDCCKPSCAWRGKGPANPVRSCAKDGSTVVGNNKKSGCEGGPAFSCTNQSPWAVSDNLAYGFAAYNGAGSCCKCYKLQFTNTAVAGKTMIVQATNTGGDLGHAHFDIQMPGGGVGIYNGCKPQWEAPSDGWGNRYGGVTGKGACNQLPSTLRSGCKWRFDWFKGADNPNVKFSEVVCPNELTQKTGCFA